MCFLARYAIGAALSTAHRSPSEPHKGLTGVDGRRLAFLGAVRRFSASVPGVNRALQMRSLALSTVGEFEKERTRLGTKSDFFLAWQIGCVAWENMQKRVSHGETVRVGSSVIIIRGNYGGIFCPPLSDIRGKIIFLRGSFALCPRVFPTLHSTK